MNVCNGFLGGFKDKVLKPIMDKILKDGKMDEMDSKNENENDLDMQKLCAFTAGVVNEKLKKIEGTHDDTDENMANEMEDIQICSLLIKEWITTYYPPAVIDQNIVNVLHKIKTDTYSSDVAMNGLNAWSSFVMIFADEKNRKIAKIEDDKFWKRFASTLLVVQIIS